MSCESELRCPAVTVTRRALIVSGLAVALLGVTLCSYTTYAFVRLNQEAGGMTWAGNAPLIPYVIRRAGSDDIPDESEDAAIRLAFAAWEEVTGSGISFYEDLGPDRDRPSSDYTDNGVHMITFDENNETGFFGTASSGLVAITPVEFVGNQIVDADIIFNGRDFTFSTPTANPGGSTFDIQAVATHEIGHLLGLDHSPVWGCTMVPFTFSNSKTQRSLQADDIAGARSLYPVASGTGSLTGSWTVGGNPIVAGHVVAIDQNGIPASSTLTAADGSFAISGLAFGTYEVYVEPLDGPVTDANMFQISNPTTSFTTTFVGGNSSPSDIFLAAGEILDLGALVALPDPSGQKYNLTSVNQGNMGVGNLGKTITVSFGGNGLFPGSILEVGNDNGDVQVNNALFNGNQVIATLYVQPFAMPGLRSVIVRNAGGDNLAILTGGFEVMRPGPTITGLSPSDGPGGGGTQVFIDGEDFVDGCKVLYGDTLAENVQLASPTRLVTQTPSHAQGSVLVTVIHPNGQDATFNGFSFTSDGAPPPPTPTPNPAPSNPAPGASAEGGGGGGGGGCAMGSAPDGAAWTWLLGVGLLVLARRRRPATQRA